MGLFSDFLVEQSANCVDQNAVRPTQLPEDGEMVGTFDRNELAGCPRSQAFLVKVD